METTAIEQLITETLTTEYVKVYGDGKHFTAIVVSDAFINQKSLARQRLVLAGLQAALSSNALHAITLKTFTLAEWRAQSEVVPT